MGFRESVDASVLYDKAMDKDVMLSKGTVFPLSDIEGVLPHYERLFKVYPEMGFFVLPLPYGNRDNPKKSYCVTRNNTIVENKLLIDEEIIWTAARDIYNFHGRKQSPRRLFWRILGLTGDYEDNWEPSPINKRIRDLEQLSKIANRLPEKWTRTNLRIGNSIRGQIGFGQSAIVPTQASIDDYTPTRLEREAAGW